ncbi:hypothetical protein BC829DRAFT_441127 [Chytridium lagenaria]|nr:hypothetical protein BC829DRAFT_441127 [Chytridium lagenaria]
MEACLNVLTEKVNDLNILIHLRVPSTSNASPSSAAVSHINQSLDEIEKRMKECWRIIENEKKMLEEEREAVLGDLQRTGITLMNMIENLKHLPKAKFSEKKGLREAPDSGGNDMMREEPSTRNILQPSNQANVNVAVTKAPLEPSSENISAKQEFPPEAKKMSLSILPITVTEFDAIPKYLVNRLSRDKMNDLISELNKVIAEKYQTLKLPQPKMTKVQRERFWDHKKLIMEDTKGKAFITEKDIKENWSKSAFKLDPVGRGVIAAIRHLGRIKEVRGAGIHE